MSDRKDRDREFDKLINLEMQKQLTKNDHI